MKVWKIAFHDPDHGTILEWFRNSTEAKQRKLELEQIFHDDEGFTVYEFDGIHIPNGKDDFVLWLNQNFNRDNG